MSIRACMHVCARAQELEGASALLLLHKGATESEPAMPP